MTRVRRVHVAAAIVNGLALACALLGRATAAELLLCTSVILLVWSLEQLHAAANRETRR